MDAYNLGIWAESRNDAQSAFDNSGIPTTFKRRHQPDPGCETASRGECLPVADLGNQCGGADRADAWDLRQPSARLTPAVQGHDALVNGCYLGADSTILPRQYLENAADGRGNPAISGVRDDSPHFSSYSSVNQAGAGRLFERSGERAIFLAVGAGERGDPVQVILRPDRGCLARPATDHNTARS